MTEKKSILSTDQQNSLENASDGSVAQRVILIEDRSSVISGQVKITSVDTTANYLNDKLEVTAPIVKEVTNPAGDERLNISIDQTGIDHTNLQNIGTNNHDQIDTHIATAETNFSTYNSHIADNTIHQTNDEVIEYLGNQTGDPHGFVDDADANATFDELTRTFTISPVSASYEIYSDGEKITISTNKTLIITNVDGDHYIYFDNTGTLGETNSIDTIFSNGYIFCAFIHWDADDQVATVFLDNERHTVRFPKRVWVYNHQNFGTQHISGLALSNILADESGNLDSHASFVCNSGVIADEDIYHIINQQTTFEKFYRLGTSGKWKKTTADSFAVTTTGTGRAAWNEFTGATWQLSEVTNNQFVLSIIVATSKDLNEVIVFVGQNTYSTLTAAQDAALTEASNLITEGLPSVEFIFLGVIINQTNNLYSNAVKTRIRSLSDGSDYLNLLSSTINSTNSPADHGNLDGLQDDDHNTIYAKIPLISTVTTSTLSTVVRDTLYIADSSAGVVTLTLPLLSNYDVGHRFMIKRIGANLVTIDGNGSETIDGALTIELKADYESRTLIKRTSTDWAII